MKKEFKLSLPLATLLCLLAPSILAQSTMNIDLSAGPGYQYNLFNSPDQYINSAGDTLGENDLIASEAFLQFNGEFELEWDRQAHEIAWKTEAELIRYPRSKQANATEILTELSYDHDPGNRWTEGGSVRLRSQDRLGTNVLGNELLIPFSFRQINGDAFLAYESETGHSTELAIAYSYKDYDLCESCDLQGRDVSLDQREWELQLRQEIKTGEHARRTQKIGLELEARDRRYFNWTNYEILVNDPDPLAEEPFLDFDANIDYQPRKWRYLIAQVDFSMPMTTDIKLKPFIEFTRRFDISNGDFSYVQWQPGIRGYLRSENWDASLSFSYTTRDYDDRLARVPEGVPFPTLEYRYLRLRLDMDRRLVGNWYITAEAGFTSRNSNTTEINTRVRRSYTNYFGVIGVRWQMERERNPSQKG